MNKKRISAVGLIGILVVAAIMREFTDLGAAENTTSTTSQQEHHYHNENNHSHDHHEDHDHDDNNRQSPIDYTRHARCRMGCRQISEQEIFEVLKSGQKNIKKSNPQAAPCPVTAMEGRTSDDQTVRVVYGQCGEVRKIITVIDLKNDFPCDCD